MSVTLHEQSLETLSPYPNPNVQTTLRLKVESVDNVPDLLPPSYLPCLDARPSVDRNWQSTEVPFRDAARLKRFCSKHGLSSHSVLQLAWALTLRCYLGNPSVCFTCHSVGGSGTALGSVAANSDGGICKVDIEPEKLLIVLLEMIERQNGGAHSPWRGAQTFSADHGRSPQSVPTNTGLLLQEDSSHDLLDVNGSQNCSLGDDELIDVSSSRSLESATREGQNLLV